MFHLVFQLVLHTSLYTLVTAVPTDIVSTTKGPVRGELLTTVQRKITYSSFNGIPYGKPPVGYLRFKNETSQFRDMKISSILHRRIWDILSEPPVEAENWTKPFDAVGPTKGCPQFDSEYFGDEDCLYLNVYTPKTTFNSSDLAVMVWIHGGYFLVGDANSSYYGPDFLIEDNVVVVFVSYRLGALGFLSLNHTNATGNAALKDQVLALKWVQQNIKNFGGDPTRVTIIGQSAGSVSVQLLTISDMSKGLYNRSISMSGSPLNYWGFSSTSGAVERARLLGSLLNISTTNSDELLRGLYRASAWDIITATHKIGDRMIQTSDMEIDIPFSPTIEDPRVSKNIFLDDCASRKFRTRQYHDLPHLLGFVDSEMAGLFPESLANFPAVSRNLSGTAFDKFVNSVRRIANKLHAPLPNFFKRYDQATHNGTEPIVNEMNELNDNAWEGMLDEGVNVTTDIFFILGIDQTQQYRSRSSAPVYYYRNTFVNEALPHFTAGTKLHGVGHGDDLAEIFWMPTKNQPLDPNHPMSRQRTKIVRMWTNFAKFGNPTPNGSSDPLLNVTWIPSGQDGLCLELGQNLTMRSRPIRNFVRMAEMSGTPVEQSLNGCMDSQIF